MQNRFHHMAPGKVTKKTNQRSCDHEPIKKRLTTDSKPKSIAPSAVEKIVRIIRNRSHRALCLLRRQRPSQCKLRRLMPESCFWKNAVGKLEPYRRATFGVGALESNSEPT
ncbi:Uncharacterized protein Adt_39964 [Abeliophyllum distichum]|uniref:Uncharacterized protein n=1 Tax=Abeliophyllum distichum TaxID=126358 RepID=A0ABD1Q6L1_9LAMI